MVQSRAVLPSFIRSFVCAANQPVIVIVMEIVVISPSPLGSVCERGCAAAAGNK